MSTPQSFASGASLMVLLRWAMRCIGIVSLLILARFLTPEDYGVVALSLLVLGALETASYAGADLALIRKENLSADDLNTGWTIQIIQAVFVATGLILASTVAPSLLKDERTKTILLVFAVTAMIEGFQNIGVINFRKGLDFKREFKFEIVKKLISFAVTVSCAVYFRNYWALVIGHLSGVLAGTILSYVLHPYRPSFSLASAKELWGFSQWVLVSRIGTYLGKKIDSMTMGYLFGPTQMGVYHVANEVSSVPLSEIVMPIRRAMFPTLSKQLGDKARFTSAIHLAVSVGGLVCILLGAGLSACASVFVPVVLGSQWVSAISVLEWLGIIGITAGLASLLELPLWVLGKAKIAANLSWFEVVLTIVAVVSVAPTFGMIGVAQSRLAVSVVMLIIFSFIVARACEIKLSILIEPLMRPIISAVAMWFAIVWLKSTATLNMPLMLLACIAFGTFVFFAVLFVCWALMRRPRGVEATISERASAMWKSRIR